MAKLSIYLPDDVHALLCNPESESGRIATIIRMYTDVARESRPILTRAEWCGLFDHMNGLEVAGEMADLRLLWANITEHDGLGAKWGFDQALLAQKLHGLPYPQLVAIYEVKEQFWAADPARAIDRVLDSLGVPPRPGEAMFAEFAELAVAEDPIPD